MSKATKKPVQRPAKCLRDSKTGEPIMLDNTVESRAWGRAGKASAKRLMEALSKDSEEENSVQVRKGFVLSRMVDGRECFLNSVGGDNELDEAMLFLEQREAKAFARSQKRYFDCIYKVKKITRITILD